MCKVWLHLMVRKCIANDVKDVFFIPFYSNWPLVIVIHWFLKWRTKWVFVTAVNLNPADEMCPQRAEGPSVPAGQTLAETFQGAVWSGAENRAGLQPLLHRLVVVFVWGPQLCWPAVDKNLNFFRMATLNCKWKNNTSRKRPSSILTVFVPTPLF